MDIINVIFFIVNMKILEGEEGESNREKEKKKREREILL